MCMHRCEYISNCGRESGRAGTWGQGWAYPVLCRQLIRLGTGDNILKGERQQSDQILMTLTLLLTAAAATTTTTTTTMTAAGKYTTASQVAKQLGARVMVGIKPSRRLR